MRVALGSDHAGWPLRDRMIDVLQGAGHLLVPCGPISLTPGDDYPDVAAAVARAVAHGEADRGVVVCGSGVGASVAANKLRGIRCALCHDVFSARQGVEDDDMNVIALGARVIGSELAADVLRAFLAATFSGLDRHRRRVAKIALLESSPG